MENVSFILRKKYSTNFLATPIYMHTHVLWPQTQKRTYTQACPQSDRKDRNMHTRYKHAWPLGCGVNITHWLPFHFLSFSTQCAQGPSNLKYPGPLGKSSCPASSGKGKFSWNQAPYLRESRCLSKWGLKPLESGKPGFQIKKLPLNTASLASLLSENSSLPKPQTPSGQLLDIYSFVWIILIW